MPLFDGTIPATVPSKPQNMQDSLHKQALQYSGVYFAYDPRRREGAGFSVLDGRNPMSHLSDMEAHNHMFYRQENNSSEEHHSQSSVCHAPVKQGFTLYMESPGISNATAATSVTVGEPKTGGENLPPPPENSIYLAVPKPLYGHNPCCNELGCVMGRYSVEHGSLRIPKTVYQHDWMQTGAHYTERQPVQRKTQDTLLQQRGVQNEHSAEPLKRISVETYRQSMIDPNYSNYPCTPTRTLLNSLSERSLQLQSSPRSYPSLYPSHPTYEHMTSEVYQERSPMSKYGHLTQYPVFYYPQANEEPQNSAQCKNIGSKQREDVPVMLKHTISTPREHYIVPQSLHGEIPLPRTETLPNHSFVQGFDYPCYAVPRINLNASQIRVPLKKQHASPSFHSNSINVSPSSQHWEHPLASVIDLHKDKSNTSLHVEQLKPSSPFLCRNLSTSARCTNHPGVSPQNLKTSQFFPSISSLLVDQHIRAPGGLNMNKRMDYSSCESHIPWPEQPKYFPVSPGAWLSRSPSQSSDRIHTAVSNSANVKKTIYSPAASQGNNNNSPASSSGTTVIKRCLKRSVSHPSPPIKIKEEVSDFCEVDLMKKRHKMEMLENVKVEKQVAKPLMPVIDNVFSLAQYQTYLQVTRMISGGQVPQSTVQSSEDCEVKCRPDIKQKMSDRDEEQPVVSIVPQEICPDTPIEKPVVNIIEHKNIKLEKVDSSDTDDTIEPLESQQEYSKVIIKQEPEEADLFESEPMLVIKKCEADEPDDEVKPESKASCADEKRTSGEAETVELTTQMHPSSDTCTKREQVAALHSTPSTPTQLSESKVDFKNIPAQYLKLSTVKILLPDFRHSSPAPPSEKPPVQPLTVGVPKVEVQMPVRKHFLELHNSLCKLVSKSVSASSEHELRAWLSHLQLTDPTSPSTKVQKVSCLLGVKAREKWLNEEMKTALHKVLERLREYTAQKHCPFPHVMRAGAVFLPMLVMKELLFPTVQGGFIDQVLHEHKVELRPTTLSEEKILIQLHKRACSSRLRRLMSLKHLPDIYADVVNLLYHACVCKHLESPSPDGQKRVQKLTCLPTALYRATSEREYDGGGSCCPIPTIVDNIRTGLDLDCPANGEYHTEETPVFSKFSASLVSPPASHPQRQPKDQERKSHLNRKRAKSRVKRSSRRMFLDNTLSDEEKAGDMVKNLNGGMLSDFCRTNSSDQSADGENRGNNSMDAVLDSSLIPQSPTPENSWTCPLTSDHLSPTPTDTEAEESSTLQPGILSSGSALSPVESKNCSGMILKLRKMFGSSLHKRAHYQAVSHPGTSADPSISKTGVVDEDVSNESYLCRIPKATHRWQRRGSISHTLRPLSCPSKRTCRSLSKIKYCPYLSACHSAEHRRRWVLRSAVQRARKAMRIYYPDLVGKRIRHLYEEDDKSEVWYSGEVLRIHEANSNPLKTIFEVMYDSEPEWKYYLELLIDYKKGWLKIED